MLNRPRTLATSLAALSALALGCVTPARYVAVADGVPAALGPEQRAVWLFPSDAEAHRAVLGLLTESQVEAACQATPAGDPLAAVLWPMLAGRYREAHEALRAGWDRLPEPFRRLAAADLAAELAPRDSPRTPILSLYQEAFDAQPEGPARAILELRLRQLRYGR